MDKLLCIYHGNCADGFGAAWAVRNALGEKNVEFYPGVHQAPPPDVAGRDVLMVDFAYKRPVIEEMAADANSMFIIDHHKSAAEDLKPFIVDEQTAAKWLWPGANKKISGLKTIALFDMERSGAGMTWDFFHDSVRPRLIDHIEDRDLWRFALEGTREIQAAVFSYPYDFGVWSDLMQRPLDDLRREGEAIERKHHKDIAELLKVCRRKMFIAGYEVPVASLPYTLTSDACHAMCKPVDEGLLGVFVPEFAACYWDTPDGRVFSLRSDDRYGGLDVSEIATQYGGGGHRNAAGFKVPRDHALARA